MRQHDGRLHDFVLARRAGPSHTATLLAADTEDLAQSRPAKFYVGWSAFRRFEVAKACCGFCSTRSSTSAAGRGATKGQWPSRPTGSSATAAADTVGRRFAPRCGVQCGER
ncbi:hypothetical protein [Actinoplanes sp. NPDC089786]|uniref:hypothetical protein n=1 Tax=Actinoplanes sp. NPDC089786 TaxID=3155185 RepID=UPI0034259EB2